VNLQHAKKGERRGVSPPVQPCSDCTYTGGLTSRRSRANSRTVIYKEMAMPAVPITSPEQYEKAIDVLTRVGGTWQGVGSKKRFLLVSEAQYKALAKAKVTTNDTKKGAKRGKNSRTSARP
jgi:hypothetical protein